MSLALDLIRTQPGRTAQAAGKPLTICVVGNAESTHVAARARCFAELGHRVFVITETRSSAGIAGVSELVPSYDTRLAKAFWFRVLRWISYKLRAGEVDDAWRILGFVRLLRQCRPDIVHVHFAYSYYGWLAGLLGCRPLAVTVMGGDVLFDEQGAPTATGKALTIGLLRRADYITSKSHHLTAVLDRLGGFGSKAERIVWGISVGRFRRVDAAGLRRELGLSPDRRVILSPKILQPFYRVHLIVEAMVVVARRCPEAVLLITEYLPDAEYKARIVRRIQELGLANHVLFCGRVQHGEMARYYSLADFAVAVPSSDGLPQTLLESMACETPNILTRLPRYEEIVRHESSAYFVEATPGDIAAGIIRMLEDAPLRRKIADTAYNIVRREGDLDEQARRVEHRYQELAASIRPQVSAARMPLAWWAIQRYRRDVM
ncbi:MAG: glycosyltransferase [Alphaproteobacteria bacterium]|nr:glycosyltransferase [Alphaproteobacteria bacterium]